ncbi:MAG: hypothetical protein GTN69_12395 [Armatimonadetes bacterium]|nr:hypothetical protein [Armatimonadota bacterium]
MNPRIKRRINDQLATVQDLLEQRLKVVAELGAHSRADMATEIAELARAQREMVAALQGERTARGGDVAVATPEPSVDTREVNGARYVHLPAHEWRCPSCGGCRSLKVIEPPDRPSRLDDDPAYYLADIDLRCEACQWAGAPTEVARLLTAE